MSENERRKPIQILLVEDDPEAVRTIWNMLHEKSLYTFSVNAVTQLPEALHWLTSTPDVDVVLLDLSLATHQAEMDVVNAVNDLNGRAAVVVLTTLEDEEAGLRALEHGADDYLLKEEIGTRALVRSLHYAVERKRYEAALTESEAKYRALADLSPDAILVSVGGRFVYANAAAVTLLGADDQAQIMGRSSFEVSAEGYANANQKSHLTRPTGKAQSASREVLWQRFDGTTVDVEVLSAPIAWQEQEAVLLLARDITTRKLLEEQRATLLEAEQDGRREAERAVALQRLFLGMVSHELRTPLASIKGFSSSILATDVSFGPEQLQEFVRIIDTEADRLTALINQLMDVVQVQAGMLRVEPRPTAVQDIVASVMPQLAVLMAQHRLVMTLPDDLPLVLSDPPRIGQVLVNLIGNAAKFSPSQSEVSLSASVRDDQIVFQVSNTGEGIPAEKRDQVFEVFYQVETEGGRKPGSGLGLAICKGLVEAHGGAIWVADTAAPVTTIAFTLPVAADEAGARTE